MNDFYCSILVLETSATDILIDVAVFCFWLLKMKTVDSTKLNEDVCASILLCFSPFRNFFS